MAIENLWTSADLPTLQAVAELAQSHKGHLAAGQVAAVTGLDLDTTLEALERLLKAGYIDAQALHGDNRTVAVIIGGMTERGLREVGAWPSTEVAADRLIAALDALVANASTPDERTRWQRVRDGIAGAGRDVTVGLATAVLTGQLPGQ